MLRIDPDTGQVRRIALEPGSIQDLFRQGELLWVLTDQHLQRLDPSTMELLLVRALGYGLRRGLSAGNTVWVELSGNLGAPLGIYRPDQDSWKILSGNLGLLAYADGRLWGARRRDEKSWPVLLGLDGNVTEQSPGLARWSSWESYAGSQGERTIFASCSYDSGRQTFVPAGVSPRGVAADLLEPGPCRRLPRGSGTLVPGQLLQATSDSLPGRLSSRVQFPGESLWQSGDRTAVVTPNLTVAGESAQRPVAFPVTRPHARTLIRNLNRRFTNVCSRQGDPIAWLWRCDRRPGRSALGVHTRSMPSTPERLLQT